MAESKIHCITCEQPIPAGKDHPGYFAQYYLQPPVDDPHYFIAETQTLLRYCLAVCNVLLDFSDQTEPEPDRDEFTVGELHDLAYDLAREIERRAELARDAYGRAYTQLSDK